MFANVFNDEEVENVSYRKDHTTSFVFVFVFVFVC